MMSFPRLQALFVKPKRVEGWLAARICAEELCFAHVVRSVQGKPVVTVCDTFSLASLEDAFRGRGLGRYRISCLLSPGEYQLLSSDAPNVPKEEVKTAVRWKIKDLIDYGIEEATLDVLEIPEDRNASAKGRSLIVVAARNETVRERMALFSKKGISLSAIDIPELAQRNIASLLEEEERGIAMLSFDEQGGLLTFSCRKELYLSRRIDVALPQLLEDGEEGQKQIERITLELQRSMDHFDRQFHHIPLTRLVLAPFAQSTAMQDYLAANLYVPVKTVDLNDIFEFQEPLSMEQQSRYFLTLGGALREELP